MSDYQIGMKVQGKSSGMNDYVKGEIVNVKIDDGSLYYIIKTIFNEEIHNEIYWFTSEELENLGRKHNVS